MGKDALLRDRELFRYGGAHRVRRRAARAMFGDLGGTLEAI